MDKLKEIFHGYGGNLKKITNTNFKKAKYDDWQSFVDNELKEIWNELSIETRMVIYIYAERDRVSFKVLEETGEY